MSEKEDVVVHAVTEFSSAQSTAQQFKYDAIVCSSDPKACGRCKAHEEGTHGQRSHLSFIPLALENCTVH